MHKLYRIVKSRLIKGEEPWVEERRKICQGCPLNTKNQVKLSRKVRVYKFFSDLLDTIMFSKEKDLGQCAHPDCGCPIAQKTKIKEEECPENKWKK